MLILGLDQKLQEREEKLTKVIDKAEAESRRFEELSEEMAVEIDTEI